MKENFMKSLNKLKMELKLKVLETMSIQEDSRNYLKTYKERPISTILESHSSELEKLKNYLSKKISKRGLSLEQLLELVDEYENSKVISNQ